MSDLWFDAARFEAHRALVGATWGRPVRVLDRVESTNDLGLSAVASDARTGIVWVAREQTRGRGRRGNAWVSRAGDALLMSTLLRWPAPHQTSAGLGLAAGLAVLEACQKRSSTPLAVKWPNDVLASGEKLAGILIESRTGPGGGIALVLGVGINVRSRTFESAAGRATSLALLGASDADMALEPLLADLLLALERTVPRVLAGKLHEIIAEVRAVDALQGRPVRVLDAGSEALSASGGMEVVGVARGISDAGELLVDTPSGSRRIESGHVVLD